MISEALPMDVRRRHVDALLQSLQLVRDPFPVTPDYESYFFSARLRARYEDLLSAVALRKGFVLVTGDVGVGKTTLTRLLINAMQGQGTRTALVINTFVQGQALLRVINRDFGLDANADSIEGLLDELHVFLLEQFAAGANCVLVIDDAQALTVDSLELLRQLSNLETSRHKLLQLVLVGQPELLDLLGRGDLRQLRSRIAMHLQLEPMTLDEMDAYLFHRLAAAGNGDALKVDAEAMALLWQATAGYPRRVHMVMDRCLFGALGRRLTRIDTRLMREAIAEVDIPGSAPPPRAAAPFSGRGRGILVGIVAVLVLATAVAAVSFEMLPFAALHQSWAAVQASIQSSVQSALESSGESSGESTPGAASTDANADAALQPGTLAVSETPPEAVEATVSEVAVQPATVSAAASLFAGIPEPLWQSFWLRQGIEHMPAVGQLPEDTRAALERIDAQLEAQGQRALLLTGAQRACEEHLALRLSGTEARPETLLVVTRLPRPVDPIEFGKYSPAVRWVQERLRVHGLIGAVHVDAMLGPVTVYALAQFQRAEGLTATGMLDELSLYRLSCAPRRNAPVAPQPVQVKS